MPEDNYDEAFDEKRIRQEIEKRFKEREGLVIHAGIFIIINAMLWLIYLASGGDGFPWPLIVTLGWGSGMFAHVYDYYNKFGGGAQRREDAIQREIERYRERYGYEKPKNENRPHLELTEDGEIEEVYDDSQSVKRERR
jgi:hypothetical protein